MSRVNLVKFWLFQSLIGFKINWNQFTDLLRSLNFKFQSLIGFKINWNAGVFAHTLKRESFNP